MPHMPTKEQVKAVIDEVDELELSDGAYWQLIHERLGLEYGQVFEYIFADPEFFGYVVVETKQSTSEISEKIQ
jgi:hypothetical protein